MSLPPRPDHPTRIGAYELLGLLGRGGMGTVYLGRGRDGRQVAVKVIHPELAWDTELRGRFRSEVNRVRQVPPFSTAAVLDADPDHDPPYLVVEYVDGPSLAEVVRDRGPLSPETLHSLAIGVATALTAIHSVGVIHRDLKPQNVLLPMGGVKVIDFGIARTIELTSQHTRTDQMIGTIAYMAPERFEADASRAVTPASDIFAWGVVVAFAGTGRTPFAGDSTAATAMRIITQPPDLTGLTGPLRGLVERALAKNAADRPTARTLLDELIAGGAAVPIPAPAPMWIGTAPGDVQTAVMAENKPVSVATHHRGKWLTVGVSAAGVAALAAALFVGGTLGPTVSEALDQRIAKTTTATPEPSASAVQQLGGAAAAASTQPTAVTTTASPPRAQKKTTPRAMLELLSRIFPDRKISRYSTYDDKDRLFVQLLLDGSDGPGRIALTVSRDEYPTTDVRGPVPVPEVDRIPDNCYQAVVVQARWQDGTLVQLDLSTCLPFNGKENPEAPPPLTVDEAKKVATDPRWGVEMDAEIVDAGANNFRNLRVLKG